ncbi:MAG: RCC1 domain-containing protein, partial [Gemmatimonas sp.]
KISLGTTVKMVTAGNGFTCALTTPGALYCWGLLPGSAQFVALIGSARFSPVRLASGLTFKSISANSKQVCGVTTDGRGICL